MSRKDFQLIADVIREQHENAMTDDARFGIECVASRLAQRLHQSNPRFKPEQFLRACSMTQERGK